MKIAAAFITLIIAPLLSVCQTVDKIADQAFVVVRMVNKFHVEPRKVDKAFSEDVFATMLDKTDGGRLFFMQRDIGRLAAYRTHLDDEIKHRRAGYLNLFINIYRQRLKQADSLLSAIDKRPIEFNATEKFTVAEDTSYAASIVAMQVKLCKTIKAGMLNVLEDDLPGNFKSFSPVKQKAWVDSTLVVARRKTTAVLRRHINEVLQTPDGLTPYLGNIYCETIASCFDPHTEFFPPEKKENFEGALGKQPFQFGFRIKADKNGGVLIDNLQPGSPAFKCGKLNKGDKFIDLQWEGGKLVDVSDITTRELSGLLEENNHKTAVFTMKKADGRVVQVSLQKELAVDDEDGKVKSFILKGAHSIGYIYLPAFYQDWQADNEGLNGCANDVGREILKLKKENIDGLIIDVRYNGGGSVTEATELAGIFLGAGPMAQEKNKDGKVHAIKNSDGGTVYDGHLVVLVNGYSASASEMFAAALQDYNRAVIVGAPTYGKATMQVVLPMDTNVTRETFAQTQTENYLKVTIGRLYRVSGASAQFKGVLPDIVMPDILDAYITKEANEPDALPPTVIDANKYYTPGAPLPIKALSQYVQTEIDTSKYYNAVKKLIADSKSQKEVKDMSLNIKDALANTALARDSDDGLAPGTKSKKFIVKNNAYENLRLQADNNLKELNDEFSEQVATDAAISIAYDVLAKLISK